MPRSWANERLFNLEIVALKFYLFFSLKRRRSPKNIYIYLFILVGILKEFIIITAMLSYNCLYNFEKKILWSFVLANFFFFFFFLS